MAPKPSLDSLKKANESLKRAIARPKDEFNRDSVIQRFEYSVELSWKIMKKFLEYGGAQTSAVPKDIIRLSAQAGQINDPTVWFVFLDERNKASHSYNEEIAEEVYNTAIKLPEHIDALINKLHTIK